MGYSPVYSAAFIQYTVEEPNAQFEVPVGFTAVIRQISCSQDVGAYDVTIYIQDSIDAEGLAIFTQAGVGAGENVDAQGRWVVPAGGYITLGLSTVGDSASAYVGGYLLKNVID